MESYETKLKKIQTKFLELVNKENNKYKLNEEEANLDGFFRKNKEENVWHRLDTNELFAATGLGFKKIGIFSKAMGVNTKPSHKINLNGYWILVDGQMPEKEFLKLKNHINKI